MLKNVKIRIHEEIEKIINDFFHNKIEPELKRNSEHFDELRDQICKLNDSIDLFVKNNDRINNDIHMEIKNVQDGLCVIDNELKGGLKEIKNVQDGLCVIDNELKGELKEIKNVQDGLCVIDNELKGELKEIKNVQDGLCVIDDKVSGVLNVFDLSDDFTQFEKNNKTEKNYIEMQRREYENAKIAIEDVVGQYSWHEQYPYETYLLHFYGDIRKPLFANSSELKALDFGCGPGRMIPRMKKHFKEVDGCDISQRLLNDAKKNNPDSNFYLTNGNDLGDTPLNYYDFIYCTISLQHIACYSIRKKIIENMYKSLKSEGYIVLQMAYNSDFPYVNVKKEMYLNNNKIIVKGRQPMAQYFEDHFEAPKTNGGFDVGIGKHDLENINKDFKNMFRKVKIWFSNVSNYYDDLEGNKHSKYWAEDWVYICAQK